MTSDRGPRFAVQAVVEMRLVRAVLEITISLQEDARLRQRNALHFGGRMVLGAYHDDEVGAAVGLYPTLLPSSTDPARDITVAKALSGSYAIHVGLIWWSFGILLALGYFGVSYGMFRGKVSPRTDGYGH